MKLYNIKNQEWRRGDFKRGDTWRSDAAYLCEICRTKTNEWIMGGYPGMGPRIICPGDSYLEHNYLESTLKQHKKLCSQIKDFEEILNEISDTEQKKARDMVDNLHVQKSLLEIKISNLRMLFSRKLDDIQGLNDNAEIIEYYPCSRIASEKTSLKDKTAKN